MTEEKTTESAATAGAAVAEPVGSVGSCTEVGEHALIVGRFADLQTAATIYRELLELENDGSLHIDGVLVVKADLDGKLHVERMVEHSTRTGLKWGIVGGVLAGVFLPATIVAGAVTLGIAGAAAGKARNLAHKHGVEQHLTPVLVPGSSGVLCLALLTHETAIAGVMSSAEALKTIPVDTETAEAVRQAAAIGK